MQVCLREAIYGVIPCEGYDNRQYFAGILQ